MSLSLDLDVIDGFRAIARQVANTLYNADFAGNQFRVDALDRITNTRQFQDFEIEKERLEFEITQERISRNVSTGEITRKDTPIENPNRRRRRKRKKQGG